MNKSIDDEIDRVLEILGGIEPKSEEYGKVIRNLNGLYDVKGKDVSQFLEQKEKPEKPEKPERLIDYNTIVIAVTNLFGILLILNHEMLHPITTKAIGFIVKGRI